MPDNDPIIDYEKQLEETKNKIRKKKKTFSFILGGIVLFFVAVFNINNHLIENPFTNNLNFIQLLFFVFVCCVVLFFFWHVFSIVRLKKRANRIKLRLYDQMKLSSGK